MSPRSRNARISRWMGALLVSLALVSVAALADAAEIGRKQLVEYVEWRFADTTPAPGPQRWVGPLRSFLNEPPAAMTAQIRRRAAWVLLDHEWQLLQSAGAALERQAAVFRMQRAVASLEEACGLVPSPEWIGRLLIAHGYLTDPRVTSLAVTVQDPARVRNDVRRALADELAPSNSSGANGEIQQQFRSAFGDAVRSLGQAMVTRRVAAEAIGRVYGRSAPDAPEDLGKLEKRALYESDGRVFGAVADILHAVFPDVNPKRELPSLLVQYGEMRRGLALAPGEDPQLTPERSFAMRKDGTFPGLSPEQADRELDNNLRDQAFRKLLAKLEPLVTDELKTIRALADPVPAEDLLPYAPLGEETARVAGRALDTGDAPAFWSHRFQLMEELYGDPSMIGPRREIDESTPPRLVTSEQQAKLEAIFQLVNRILAPQKLPESPDRWIARFLAESVGAAP